MKNNKKGFTLIELLAVIVVLAVLILLAMPKVTSMMEKARRNSFAVETTEIVKVAQTAYSDIQMSNGAADCFPVSVLISKGYLDKKENELTGYVYLKKTISDTSEEFKIDVKIKKGDYMIIQSDGQGKFDAETVTKLNDSTFGTGACPGGSTALAE